MKGFFVTCFLLINSFVCFSQSNSINQYLDDNGWSDAKDIIKIDLTGIIQSNIMIIWDHRFTENFALQGGYGLLKYDSYKPLIRPLGTESSLNPAIKGGYSLYCQPTYYLEGLESFHIGLPLQYRRHGDQASSFQWNVGLGYQWFLSRHISLDFETGIGLNFEYSLDGKSYIYNKVILDENRELAKASRSRLLFFPLNFKLGYVL